MATVWYVTIDGQVRGPGSTDQLRQLAASGQLKPTDWVWKEGMARWALAGKVRGLWPAAVGTPPSPTPPDTNPFAGLGEDDPPSPAGQEEADPFAGLGWDDPPGPRPGRRWAKGSGPRRDRTAPPKYQLADSVAWFLLRGWLDTRPHAVGVVAVLVLIMVLLLVPAGVMSELDKHPARRPPQAIQTAVFLFLVLGWCVTGSLALFARWGIRTACPACEKTWARILRLETYLGRSRGTATVTRTDVHKTASGARIGTTERDEQILVTYHHYRHDWRCRFCTHEWDTKSTSVTEGW
ncbi:MAG: hypothetical protein JWO38_1317 [Gemmataceae bacterium]|nr:hypothetical protein [Gemmataceae bacterium]